MLKCKCNRCKTEETFANHKEAWFKGWDFIDGTATCGDCKGSVDFSDLKELLIVR